MLVLAVSRRVLLALNKAYRVNGHQVVPEMHYGQSRTCRSYQSCKTCHEARDGGSP